MCALEHEKSDGESAVIVRRRWPELRFATCSSIGPHNALRDIGHNATTTATRRAARGFRPGNRRGI
jgi:hypothetical protein